jgi:hypothetical protein
MNASHPPRLATWLLKRLGSGPKRESLIGDLIEQYQRRRSGVWYWRQVLRAILTGVVHDLGAHKVLAMRAVVIYFLLYWLFGFLASQLYQSVGIVMWNWTVAHEFDGVRKLWFGGPPPLVPVPPLLLMTWLGSAIAGAIVARSHRDYAPAMLFSCAVAVWLYAFAQGQGWVFGLPGILRHHIGGHGIARAVFLIGVPVSVVFGGIWGSGPAASDSAGQRATIEMEIEREP